MKKIFFLCSLGALLFSCNDGKKYLPESKGAPYEIVVVTSKTVWEGEFGDTLRHAMGLTIPMLNQREPMFSLLSVPEADYKNTMARHRNVIVVNIDKSVEKPSMTAAYDVVSQPQLEATISAPSTSAAITYVWENQAALQKIFNMAERDRLVKRSKKFANKDIDKLFKNKFGFDAYVPDTYRVRREEQDFVWTSNELPSVSMGIVVYQYPYEQKEQFSLANLVAKRNEFVGKFIPGPSDGSYMITTEVVPPIIRTVKINGRIWTEIRGFWEVANNYMGGPFISYSTLDQETGKIVTIDNYLFSPKLPKRNYYRQLENFIYTVKFPTQSEMKTQTK